MTELLAASSIAFLILGVIFTLWIFAEKAWYSERVKAKLLGRVEIAMERVKQELRGSNADLMVRFPVGGSTFKAISFPMVVDDDGDGFVNFDNGGTPDYFGDDTIIWNRTVIYHIYNTATDSEFRRTIFTSFNSDEDARQTYLDTVVANGTIGSATTRTLFSQPLIGGSPSIIFVTVPQLREFDGYSSSIQRSDNVSFGSAVITPGYHTLSFKVTQAGAGAGFGLGLDLFRITPSVSDREGEDYTFLIHPDASVGITASSGDTITRENMFTQGSWSGDYHLDYAANAVDDFLTLNFYNDVWRESNFDLGTQDLVVVELCNEDGTLTLKDRSQQDTSGDHMVRLQGGGIVWSAADQTGGAKEDADLTYAPLSGGATIRNVITGPYIDENGRKLRIKFTAGTAGSVTIDAAAICKRTTIEDGEAPASAILFNLLPNITITAGTSEWSDWIDLSDNIDNSNDYLVSIFLPDGTHSIASWDNAAWNNNADTASSYIAAGANEAATLDWVFAPALQGRIYGIEEVQVSYVDNGTLTSQIYDRGPVGTTYGNLTWNIERNNYPDANVILRVRSNNDKATLLADADWSDETSIDTQSAIQGSVDISAIGAGRYVQFQADLMAIDDDAAEQTNDEYDMSCILKDVAIYWPGASTACDVSGYFTMKPGYGKFTAEVDGQPMTKGFEMSLEISEEGHGVSITRSIKAEVEPRNTGK